jgi:flagellar M-ring protein FliF
VVDVPGKIKRLSLAVVIDGKYQEKSHKFSPRTPEEMRQFANLAKKAVGFNSERGDQLEISCAPLAVQAADGSTAFNPGENWQHGLAFSWKIGVLVLLILVGLMFLLKRRRAPIQPPLLKGPPPAALPTTAVQEAFLPENDSPVPLPANQPRPALPEPVDGQEKVSRLITTYPDRAVEVLRLWMHEKD